MRQIFKNIFKEVGSATALWREEATKLKIRKTEIDRMAYAFEHKDLQKALQLLPDMDI